MQKFSPEEAQRIIVESRAILERGRWEAHRAVDEPPVYEDDTPTEAVSPPVESRMDCDRCEIDEQEARFAAERGRRERERRLDTRLLTADDVETLIAAALCAERQAVIPISRRGH
jgi:hypothetical protein